MHKQYDLGTLQEIAQGDEAFVQDMLVTFVENVTEDIEKIQSLRPMENWKSIAEIAHRLTSRYAYLNAVSLQALSADIEKSVLEDNNFAGIADKLDSLSDSTILLIAQLKNDFEFLCKT